MTLHGWRNERIGAGFLSLDRCVRARCILNAMASNRLQPFSQESRTPTVAKECQIGLYDPSEADLALFWNSSSAGILRERL
mgnify:CR=1 FL=1